MLTTDCPKHGPNVHALPALPVIHGKIEPGTKLTWWQKLTAPRVCMRCLAEAMVSPIRRGERPEPHAARVMGPQP